mmetsp:Transcript_42076/g.87747  ORF Transcript_42076/g.87747 Transcript_42076/m.87747 type:complete len:205 (-) Transcript_42076:178-792(-)
MSLDIDHDKLVVDTNGAVGLALGSTGVRCHYDVFAIIALGKESGHVEDTREFVAGGTAPGSLGDGDLASDTGVVLATTHCYEVVGEFLSITFVFELGDKHAFAERVSTVFLQDGVELSIGSLNDLESINVFEGSAGRFWIVIIHGGIGSINVLSLSSEFDLVHNIELSLVNKVVTFEGIGKTTIGTGERLHNIFDLFSVGSVFN